MLLKKSFAKQISIYESAKNDAITSKNGHSCLQTSLGDSNIHLMKVYFELGSSNMQMGVCFDLGNSQCA
jgi:hypothetical protein